MLILREEFSLTQFSLRLLTLCTSIVMTGIHVIPQAAPPTSNPPQLVRPGDIVERSTAGGQRNEFQVDCSGSTYSKLTIEQNGIDVGARFLGPQERRFSILTQILATRAKKWSSLYAHRQRNPLSFPSRRGKEVPRRASLF